MKQNETIAEKPNHAHYQACYNRKMQIDQFAKRTFLVTSIESAILALLTIFGFHLGIFSLIPSLCGNEFNIGYLLIQFIEIAAFFALGVLGHTKTNKIFDLIIFIVNLLLVASCLISGIQRLDVFTSFAVGVVCTIMTYPAYSAYFDYRQLSETEGFPKFSAMLAHAEDNAEYKSFYFERAKNNKPDDDMPVVEKPVEQVTSNSKAAYMDDIPFNNQNK